MTPLFQDPDLTALTEAMDAHRRGDRTAAEARYRAFLEDNPGHPDGVALLGVLKAEAGAHEEALDLLDRAVASDPGAALFRLYRGDVLLAAGKTAGAADEYRMALARAPDLAAAHHNLGRALQKQGALEDALIEFMQALALAPKNHATYLAAGTTLAELERHEEAEIYYKGAIVLKPDNADTWDNLGLSLRFMNRLDEAEDACRKAIALSGQTLLDEYIAGAAPEKIGPRHWHLSLVELMKGNYALGFARYRCRLTARGWLARANLAKPIWAGEDISGKTVIVRDEGGNGDTFMMCRYLPLLKARGARVKFWVKPSLKSLFDGWDGVDELLTYDDDPGDFDFYTWMLELAYAFGTTLETVPADFPYLPCPTPDDNTQLPPDARPKVGVVWAGAPGNVNDRRHIPLDIFARLFADERCAFYNLTRDKRREDEERLAGLPVVDLAPRQRDFGDLARFIAQMDLVIGCDTATPQLAAAMGKKAWTLLPFSPDWRWTIDRENSPWYPGMRLFRQKQPGNWGETIERVAAALKLATHR